MVLLQETHHTDEAEGQAWTQEGPDGLRPNWTDRQITAVDLSIITFGAASTSIRHLGIPLSTDLDATATALYTDILQRLQARIARWSGFRLSLLGRAHVAKQVLVAMFHIPWHLHTGTRAAPQTALHIGIHLRGGQPASSRRGGTSVPQQTCFQQDTPAGWYCPCGHPSPADSTPFFLFFFFFLKKKPYMSAKVANRKATISSLTTM